jgi:hypothetical protein
MPIKIRPIRICGDVAYVPLTQGYTAIIDAADVPLIDGRNWCVAVAPHTVYAFRSDYSGGKKLNVCMHRVIMREPDGFEVDHEDGDGLNNRQYNLRVATHAQNMCNRRVNINNKSGLKGVSWRKESGKWVASISLNSKDKYLGLFDSPEEAHAAYCRASDKYHGEFGRTE